MRLSVYLFLSGGVSLCDRVGEKTENERVCGEGVRQNSGNPAESPAAGAAARRLPAVRGEKKSASRVGGGRAFAAKRGELGT